MMFWIWVWALVLLLGIYAAMIGGFGRGWRAALRRGSLRKYQVRQTTTPIDLSGTNEAALRPQEDWSGRGGDEAAIEISVVVAARNEATRQGPLLEALSRQTTRRIWELIWVDDESTDCGAEQVVAYSDEHKHLIVRVLRRDGRDAWPRHKKGAVAMGVQEARAPVVLVTDADCVPGIDWIEAMADPLLRNTSLEFVGGPVRLGPLHSRWHRSQALEFMTLNAIAASSIAGGRPILSNGGNMAFRKASFLELQPYASNMVHPGGDDDFLMHRIAGHFGSKAVDFCLDQEAMITTPPVDGWSDFVQQRTRWVSKQGAYPDPWITWVLKGVWVMQALLAAGMLLGGLLGGIYHEMALVGLLSFTVWMVKGVLDGYFARQAAPFYKLQAGWPLLFLTHAWYLPYTLWVGLLGYRGRFRWKDRQYG